MYYERQQRIYEYAGSLAAYLRSRFVLQTHCELVYRHLQFHEPGQQFIGADDETLSVAMRVHNPDCSPFKIQG